MTKRILLLNNAYWPSIGGVENSIRHLAAEAANNGYAAKVIVSNIGLTTDSNFNKTDIIDGIQVDRYPIYPIRTSILKFLNTFASSWHLYKILKSEYKAHPKSIVIARFHISAVIATLVGFKNVRYLIPSVIENQSAIEMSPNEKFTKKIRGMLFIKWHSYWQKLAIRLCRNFVFSQSMALQCGKISGAELSNFSLVKPGVDNNRFSPAAPEIKTRLKEKLQLPSDKTIVLFVGRFVKAKGCDLLIQSMPLLPNNFHLVLVGDGTEMNAYLNLIKSNSISDKITIVKSTRTVEEYYKCSDIFVMCSRYEPLGQTILEAFSCGLPVVAFTPQPGIDTATHELGMNDFIWYSDVASKEGLADAIKLCASKLNPAKKDLISENAKTKFSWSNLLSSLTK